MSTQQSLRQQARRQQTSPETRLQRRGGSIRRIETQEDIRRRRREARERERQEQRTDEREAFASRVESETGVSVSLSEVVAKNGQLRLTPQARKKVEAAEFSERLGESVSPSQVVLSGGKSRLTKQAQKELAADDLSKQTGVSLLPSQLTIQNGQVQLTDQAEKKVAAQNLSEQLGTTILPSEVTQQGDQFVVQQETTGQRGGGTATGQTGGGTATAQERRDQAATTLLGKPLREGSDKTLGDVFSQSDVVFKDVTGGSAKEATISQQARNQFRQQRQQEQRQQAISNLFSQPLQEGSNKTVGDVFSQSDVVFKDVTGGSAKEATISEQARLQEAARQSPFGVNQLTIKDGKVQPTKQGRIQEAAEQSDVFGMGDLQIQDGKVVATEQARVREAIEQFQPKTDRQIGREAIKLTDQGATLTDRARKLELTADIAQQTNTLVAPRNIKLTEQGPQLKQAGQERVEAAQRQEAVQNLLSQPLKNRSGTVGDVFNRDDITVSKQTTGNAPETRQELINRYVNDESIPSEFDVAGDSGVGRQDILTLTENKQQFQQAREAATQTTFQAQIKDSALQNQQQQAQQALSQSPFSQQQREQIRRVAKFNPDLKVSELTIQDGTVKSIADALGEQRIERAAKRNTPDAVSPEQAAQRQAKQQAAQEIEEDIRSQINTNLTGTIGGGFASDLNITAGDLVRQDGSFTLSESAKQEAQQAAQEATVQQIDIQTPFQEIRAEDVQQTEQGVSLTPEAQRQREQIQGEQTVPVPNVGQVAESVDPFGVIGQPQRQTQTEQVPVPNVGQVAESVDPFGVIGQGQQTQESINLPNVGQVVQGVDPFGVVRSQRRQRQRETINLPNVGQVAESVDPFGVFEEQRERRQRAQAAEDIERQITTTPEQRLAENIGGGQSPFTGAQIAESVFRTGTEQTPLNVNLSAEDVQQTPQGFALSEQGQQTVGQAQRERFAQSLEGALGTNLDLGAGAIERTPQGLELTPSARRGLQAEQQAEIAQQQFERRQEIESQIESQSDFKRGSDFFFQQGQVVLTPSARRTLEQRQALNELQQTPGVDAQTEFGAGLSGGLVTAEQRRQRLLEKRFGDIPNVDPAVEFGSGTAGGLGSAKVAEQRAAANIEAQVNQNLENDINITPADVESRGMGAFGQDNEFSLTLGTRKTITKRRAASQLSEQRGYEITPNLIKVKQTDSGLQASLKESVSEQATKQTRKSASGGGDIFSGVVDATEDVSGLNAPGEGSVVNVAKVENTFGTTGITGSLIEPVEDLQGAFKKGGEFVSQQVVEPTADVATFAFTHANRQGLASTRAARAAVELQQGDVSQTFESLSGRAPGQQQTLGEGFAFGAVRGAGEIVNVPQLAATALTVADVGITGAQRTLSGEGGEFATELAGTAALLGARAAEQSISQPARTAGMLLGGSLGSVGAGRATKGLFLRARGRLATRGLDIQGEIPIENIERPDVRSGQAGGLTRLSTKAAPEGKLSIPPEQLPAQPASTAVEEIKNLAREFDDPRIREALDTQPDESVVYRAVGGRKPEIYEPRSQRPYDPDATFLAPSVARNFLDIEGDASGTSGLRRPKPIAAAKSLSQAAKGEDIPNIVATAGKIEELPSGVGSRADITEFLQDQRNTGKFFAPNSKQQAVSGESEVYVSAEGAVSTEARYSKVAGKMLDPDRMSGTGVVEPGETTRFIEVGKPYQTRIRGERVPIQMFRQDTGDVVPLSKQTRIRGAARSARERIGGLLDDERGQFTLAGRTGRFSRRVDSDDRPRDRDVEPTQPYRPGGEPGTPFIPTGFDTGDSPTPTPTETDFESGSFGTLPGVDSPTETITFGDGSITGETAGQQGTVPTSPSVDTGVQTPTFEQPTTATGTGTPSGTVGSPFESPSDAVNLGTGIESIETTPNVSEPSVPTGTTPTPTEPTFDGTPTDPTGTPTEPTGTPSGTNVPTFETPTSTNEPTPTVTEPTGDVPTSLFEPTIPDSPYNFDTPGTPGIPDTPGTPYNPGTPNIPTTPTPEPTPTPTPTTSITEPTTAAMTMPAEGFGAFTFGGQPTGDRTRFNLELDDREGEPEPLRLEAGPQGQRFVNPIATGTEFLLGTNRAEELSASVLPAEQDPEGQPTGNIEPLSEVGREALETNTLFAGSAFGIQTR